MKEHVHPCKRPGRPVYFLPIEREIVRTHLFGGADEEGARPAGRIADRVAWLGACQLGEEFGNGGGGKEFSRLLAGIRRKARDEVDIALANNILADAARAKVEFGLGEILKHVLEAAVAVLWAAEIGFGVEVDISEHAFEFRAVRVFNLFQRDIDQLTDISLAALLIKIIVARTFRQNEAFALETAANTGIVVAILFLVGFDVVGPEVRDVLQEQHHQDVVLILGRIDGATEGVARCPGGLVDLLLGYLIAHARTPAMDFEEASSTASRSRRLLRW